MSNQIASLVQNISASSRQQASAAQNIARNMGVLREISSQTAENSAATSNSVGKLAELSAQLRKSVAGFRLPDRATGGFFSATMETMQHALVRPRHAGYIAFQNQAGDILRVEAASRSRSRSRPGRNRARHTRRWPVSSAATSSTMWSATNET